MEGEFAFPSYVWEEMDGFREKGEDGGGWGVHKCVRIGIRMSRFLKILN